MPHYTAGALFRFVRVGAAQQALSFICLPGQGSAGGYNSVVEPFRFCHPVSVRYADLDPQGHVNNARYLTYLEQGRAAYLIHLGLWDGQSFLDLGIVLATAEVTYRTPIRLGQEVHVWVRIARIGQKSMDMVYILEEAQTGQIFAQASTVLVTYDYRHEKTIIVPTSWRIAIQNYENLDG